MAVPCKTEECCKPVRVDLFNNLLVVESEEILGKFVSSGETFCTFPPVLPNDLGTDISQWEKSKKIFR